MNLTGNLKKGCKAFNYGKGMKSGFCPSNDSQAFSDNSSKQLAHCSVFKGGAKALNETHSLKSLFPRGPNSGHQFSPWVMDKSIKRTGKDISVNSFYNNSPCYTNFFEE